MRLLRFPALILLLSLCARFESASIPVNPAEANPAIEPTLHFLENKVYDFVLVTDDRNFRAGMEEDETLQKALEAIGRKVTRISLQDPDFDWNSTKSIVIRSAWEKYTYYDEYVEFLDWAEENSYLFNPRAIIRWQSDKINYMNELAKLVNVPKTIIIPKDADPPDMEDLMDELGCQYIVMKPAHGNGGYGVKDINPENLEERMEKVEKYLEMDDLMFQCFQKSIVDGRGELAVNFINGHVTHGVVSFPAENHFLIHECYGGTSKFYIPNEEEKEFAKRVASAVESLVGVKPMYMRVDMFYDNDDKLALMEIASGTTDLSMADNPPSADIFARGLDDFLREKETKYEELYGNKPQLLDYLTYDTTYAPKGTSSSPLTMYMHREYKLFARSEL